MVPSIQIICHVCPKLSMSIFNHYFFFFNRLKHTNYYIYYVSISQCESENINLMIIENLSV